MEWLKLLHILSAIMGIGPTFFGHVLVRSKQSPDELRQSMKLFKWIEMFPKIGGTIAVLTGILLIVLNNSTPVPDATYSIAFALAK